MKTLIITKVFLLIIVGHIFSQSIDLSIISPAGGFLESENISLAFNIGEIAIETFTTDDLILTQGFLQAEYKTVGVKHENTLASIQIYPNPAEKYFNLNIQTENFNAFDFVAELLDINGKKLQTIEIQNQISKINISHYHSGTYFVRLTNDAESFHKVFILIKINH